MKIRIRYFRSLFFVVFIVITGCPNNGNAQNLSLKTLTPHVIKTNGAEIFQYWEFRNNSALWDTNFVGLNSLQAYRDSLESILGKDTFNLKLNSIAFQNNELQADMKNYTNIEPIIQFNEILILQ